jgi:hypothetical protein
LQRELESLTRSGLLERKQDGRGTCYKANTGSAAFDDLESLLAKTVGLISALQVELEPFGNAIAWAFLCGPERGRSPQQRRCDGGRLGRHRRFGREINVTRYSEEEFCRKVRNGDHFLASVLKARRVVLLQGSEHELAAMAGAT